jgi:hypothetical protein
VMPAPRRPNTAAATAAASVAARQARHRRMADELREAGWLVLDPQVVAELTQRPPAEAAEAILSRHAS